MSYDRATVRKRVAQLTDTELQELCFDHFPEVYNLFTDGQNRSQRILLLINWVDCHGESEKLMKIIDGESPSDPPPPAEPETCDILVLSANPRGTDPLQVEQEADLIMERLKEGKPGREVPVVAEHAVRVDDLSMYILRHDPVIVHFGGHGTSEGNLVFEDDDGRPQNVTPEGLARLFDAAKGRTQCVVLNACFSMERADALAESVSCVIGMTHAIDDESARKFAGGFYRGLAFGKDYRSAFELGRAQIDLSGLPDWQTPSFHTRDLQMYDAELAISRISARGKRSTKGQTENVPKIRLWYGTNRKPNDENHIKKGYGAQRDNRIHYGTCDVTVPKSHKIGKLGSPWWWRWLTGTDDRIKMDSDSLLEMAQSSFWDSLRSDLSECPSGEKHALVFIHGYNVTFVEAALRAAQISVDLSFPGLTSFFSWPSKGRLMGYAADAETIKVAEPYLAEFLTRFATDSSAERIHLIAHSMGNRCLLHSLERVVERAAQMDKPPFEQVVLAAPDVDSDVFQQHSSAYNLAAERTTIYASPRDWPVWASSKINMGARVGYHPPVSTYPGIDTIQVEEADVESLGHGYVSGMRKVLTDVHNLIVFGAPPEKRMGLETRTTSNGDPYWSFKR